MFTIQSLRSFIFVALLVSGALGTVYRTQAATLYFDNNGATTGLGSGSANWDTTTTVWATSSSPGTTAPGLWVQGSDAGFQNGATITLTLPSSTTI
jgi:hypothetical protein